MGRPLDEDIIIKILERWQKAFKENSHYVLSDLSLVIKDVRELPTIQPVATDTNIGDTISRQVAIDALCAKCTVDKPETCSTIQKGDNWCEEVHVLQNVPSVQPEPKEGEWVQIQRCARDAQPDLECPFCKHRIGWFDMGRYCAGCGAKLKGGAG